MKEGRMRSSDPSSSLKRGDHDGDDDDDEDDDDDGWCDLMTMLNIDSHSFICNTCRDRMVVGFTTTCVICANHH
jgi:hypothetical protein